LNELPMAMAWSGDSICVGYKRVKELCVLMDSTLTPASSTSKGYNLVNAQTGAVTEIFTTDQKMIPTITPIPTNQLLLGRNGG